MKHTTLSYLFALAGLLFLTGTPANAARLTGIVVSQNGNLIQGAMVSLFDKKANRKTTVYSDQDGRFSLDSSLQGSAALRVRAPHFLDLSKDIDLSGDNPVEMILTIQSQQTPDEISDALTASAHIKKLQWHDKERQATFISQCHYCHQIGNEITRQPRDEDEWGEVIKRMEGYFTLITPWDKRAFKKVLSKGFDGKPVANNQKHIASPKLASATIEEWQVGDGNSFIHDTEVGSDGRLYGVDQGHDVVWELDRKTGKVTRHQMPDSPLPQGGLYSGAQLPIGIFTGKHGPHSLVEDEDGTFWITGSLSSTLLSFNIHTKKFNVYDVGGDALYPHTIRRAKDGLIWFTLPASNQVGRFDTKTKKFTLIDLPSNGFFRWMTDALFPTVLKIAAWFPKQNTHIWMSHHWYTGLGRKILNFPYGIDVHPQTGEIWYSKLYAGKIGVVNPKTLEVTEYDTPMSGPRRLRFDKDGYLWIPSFNEGGLMRFDPQTKKFVVYKLPSLAQGEYEIPYALNVHPDTGDIWITTNQSDRILRFDPRTEKFISYPSPTRVTFLRDLTFTKDGKICASNSNLPAYAIEGGVPVMLCIDPGDL
jgi:streptogramin lyase